MTKMTAGRAVVEALIAQNVDTVFGQFYLPLRPV